jgi:hypothetical protein
VRRWWEGLIRPAELVDVLQPAEPPSSESARRELRRLAAEALILSDDADAVIRLIRERTSLGVVAPRGGPLIRRFFALRDQLPEGLDHREQQLSQRLGTILHHHAELLSLAMDLLAYEWRSPRLAAQVDALDGMGAPAVWLEEIYAELAARIPEAGEIRPISSA